MNTVEVIEDHPARDTISGSDRPFMVKVDGELLRSTKGVGRRFKDSFAAALAGAREIDKRRTVGKEPQ